MAMVIPMAKKRLEGTNPDSDASFPDWVEPDPPEKWINEDDINWDALGEGENYVGEDDDGDCTNLDTSSQRDSNDNDMECDIIVTVDSLNSSITVDLIRMLMRTQMKKNTAKKQDTGRSF